MTGFRKKGGNLLFYIEFKRLTRPKTCRETCHKPVSGSDRFFPGKIRKNSPKFWLAGVSGPHGGRVEEEGPEASHSVSIVSGASQLVSVHLRLSRNAFIAENQKWRIVAIVFRALTIRLCERLPRRLNRTNAPHMQGASRITSAIRLA